MNYKRIYNLIVESASTRGLDKTSLTGYFEAHHIHPRCLGGIDDKSNLVLLTAREHYVAHLLLSKIYPDTSGLQVAVMLMTSNSIKLGYRKNSKLYEASRIRVSELFAKKNAPSFKDFTGQRFGRLTVVGLAGWRQRERDGCHESRWLCECDCGNYKEAAGKNLQQGSTKSCGCLAKDSYPKYSRSAGIKAKGDYKSGATTWDITGNSRPWKSHHIMKYPHNLDKWMLADYYYSLWKDFCEGESDHVFWRFYKESHNDFEVVKNYFSLMVGMFLKGWNPNEDSEWVEFSNQ